MSKQFSKSSKLKWIVCRKFMYVSQPHKCLYIYMYMIVVIIIMMIIIIISMRHDLKCVFFHVKTTQFVIILQWYTYIPFNSLTKLFTFYIITYFQTFFRNKSNCVCVCVCFWLDDCLLSLLVLTFV